MTSSDPDEKTRELHKVYASDSPEQTSTIYDGWSEEYEEHMRGAGYGGVMYGRPLCCKGKSDLKRR